MRRPLVIELFCGRFGWSRGWLELGGRAIGFDIEHLPHHGPVPDGAELVLQDVLTLHGSQFKDADLILCSPPCQAYSWMAMPWKLAKAKAAEIRADETGQKMRDLTALFDACFRIQREASEAATETYGCARCGVYHPATRLNGCEFTPRHIPMVVENVKGAQPWVGRAQAHFGSFYLWGDIAMVGGRIVAPQPRFGAEHTRAYRGQKFNPDGTAHGQGSWFKVADSKNRGVRKNDGGSWFKIGSPGQKETNRNPVHDALKVPGFNFHAHEKGVKGGSFQSAAVKMQAAGAGESYGGGFGWDGSALRTGNSHSPARKAASALIAEIPYELSAWVARCYWPIAKEKSA